MADLVFFYGTLMAGFDRRRRAGIDAKLTYLGRGAINAALFDLGLYPAAVPAPDGDVWGEVYEMADPDAVLAALDDIEGYRAGHGPIRVSTSGGQVDVRCPTVRPLPAWVYFYNAPLGRAPRIHVRRLPAARQGCAETTSSRPSPRSRARPAIIVGMAATTERHALPNYIDGQWCLFGLRPDLREPQPRQTLTT